MAFACRRWMFADAFDLVCLDLISVYKLPALQNEWQPHFRERRNAENMAAICVMLLICIRKISKKSVAISEHYFLIKLTG